MWGRLLTRKADVGVELVAHDCRRRTVKAGDPSVTVNGRAGELLLTLFGRDTDVTVDGTPEAIAAWERSHLGL